MNHNKIKMHLNCIVSNPLQYSIFYAYRIEWLSSLQLLSFSVITFVQLYPLSFQLHCVDLLLHPLATVDYLIKARFLTSSRDLGICEVLNRLLKKGTGKGPSERKIYNLMVDRWKEHEERMVLGIKWVKQDRMYRR